MAAAKVEKKRTFDTTFKLRVIIDYASRYGNRVASRMIGNLFSLLLTHSMLVVAILGLWGSSQNLPPNWSLHSLVTLCPCTMLLEQNAWLAVFITL